MIHIYYYSVHLKALEDVSPTVTAIMELRAEEERRQQKRTYMQFCGSAPVTARLVQETDSRQPDYEFPGFCYGCRKEGMCYGCLADNIPQLVFALVILMKKIIYLMK